MSCMKTTEDRQSFLNMCVCVLKHFLLKESVCEWFVRSQNLSMSFCILIYVLGKHVNLLTYIIFPRLYNCPKIKLICVLTCSSGGHNFFH